MTILYIDDDIEDIEIFQEAVKSIDPSIQYLTARNGKDALELLHAATLLPDFIVLDFNMPGMDGKTCLQEIRKEKKFDSLKAVIYSTNGFPRDIAQIESLGAKFIRKANSFRDLCEMVRSLIGK